MKENEAIEKLNMLNEALNFQRYDADESSCALQMAIQALEEIQQYRAIGTVDELQVLNRIAEETAEYVKEDKKILEVYKRIGTIEDFKALKEKAETKKPEYAPDDSCLYSEYVCPNCHIRLPHFRQKYCQCGQKLDWQ